MKGATNMASATAFPSLKRRLRVEAAAKEDRKAVEHPAHYGGADNPYEAIKVIEAWDLGFHLGNTVKYISRSGKKPGEPPLKDLKKALWYLKRKIEVMERKAGPAS
jgi:hypothetical protein